MRQALTSIRENRLGHAKSCLHRFDIVRSKIVFNPEVDP